MIARASATIILALLSACSVKAGGDDNASTPAASVAGWSGGASDAETPAAAPGAETMTRDDLIRQARTFLARPENDRDMQTALRARASTHPLLCPAVSFVPEQLVVGTTPPPVFDAAGTMTGGSLRQRFRAVGCAAKPVMSVFVITAPGMPVRTMSGLMGTTIADPQLQADTIPRAVAAAQPLLPGCATLVPIDTRFAGVDPVTSGRPLTPWVEYWLIAGCGRYVQSAVHFTPDPSNARMGVVVDSAESKLISLPTN